MLPQRTATNSVTENNITRDVPGGPAVRNLPSAAGGRGSTPSLDMGSPRDMGNQAHSPQLESPWAR